MGVVFDINGNIKQNRLFLANPQKKNIGVIAGVRNLKFTENFNNMHEISFDIYERLDGNNTRFYDAIESKRLINVENVGWFQVIKTNKKKDENTLETYKTVQCLSLENELVNKRVDALNGVYSLYDVSDTEGSLLHIISSVSGWTIGHVDNELLGLYRVFTSDTEQIYNFLTTTVSKSFDCIFIFNGYEKSISAYKLDNLGELTNIVISKRNILNEYDEESLGDYIVTKMKVKGADGVDIRAVNFGKNYLTNINYYKVPVSEPNGWMTQGLVDAIDNYNDALDTYQNSYNTLLSTYKTKQAELSTLNSGLKDLQSLQSAQDVIWQPLAQKYNGTPPSGSNDYNLYYSALTMSNYYYPLIASKKTEITTKKSEIDSVQTQLDNISSSLDESNFFTQEQMNELNTFLTEGEEYQDSTFVITDTMTDEEILDSKLQLLENAKKELAIKSQPQYTITIKANNLFSIKDDKSPIPYSKWVQGFKVGNLITLKFRDDYWVTARLISMSIDFNNLQDIELKFSNKNRLDSELVRFAETLADAGRTSTTLDYNYFGIKDASSQASDVRQFMNSTLNATLNAVKSNDNQETLFDTYGLHMRKWLPDQNKYSQYQAWWTNNTLLFTDDGWNSIKGGIGVFTDTSGNKTMSVFADVIAGTLLMGEKLYLTNTSGTYTINNNGFRSVYGNNIVTINPNNSNEIFSIAVGGVNKLYIDVASNRLVFSGALSAATGTFSGALSAATGTFSGSLSAATGTFSGTVSAGTIIGGTISGTTINGGSINGATFVSTGTIGSTVLTTTIENGYITAEGQIIVKYETSKGTLDFSSLLFYNGTTFLASYGTSASMTGNLTVGGDSLLNKVVCTTINDGTPITSLNVAGSHTHSSAALSASYGGGAIDIGSVQACGFVYANNTFQTKSSSDERIKYDIKSLEDLPIELFLELKPKQFKFKDGCNTYHQEIIFGFIAQDIEFLFNKYGLNVWNYDLIYKTQPNPLTDEGKYASDEIYRINYENLHAWITLMVQRLYYTNEKQENTISDLKLSVTNILTKIKELQQGTNIEIE